MKKEAQESGQGLVEYALVLVLIAVAVIIILTLLGDSVVFAYARITGALNGQAFTNQVVEFMVLDADIAVSRVGPSSCTVNISNMTILMAERGQVAKNDIGSVPVSAPGKSLVVQINTNNVGLANSVAVNLGTVTCPGNLQIGNTGFSTRIQ